MRRKLFAAIFALFAFTFGAFADEGDLSFGENLTSMEGHRFIEIRGAIPAFPALTSHGMIQSFVVGFADVFGDIFSGGNNFEYMTPKLATDLNITFFPPIANYHLGFMAGVAIDEWESTKTDATETDSMNFYYIGFHADYGHWVFSEIGTRLSIYGEISLGWIQSESDDSTDRAPFFDVCPIGIQFCPEKHVGIYFEFPHFGARPFFQTGISIGL